jgi:hypothetical protein
MEENMDPPSFTKSILQRTLQIEDGIEELHKIMEQKADRIEQKLNKYEGEGENQEEVKLKREPSVLN